MHVVNAGDGRHAHPSQGLLDLYTIRHFKQDFRNLTVAIVGDVLHSRVARSLIHGLTTLGTPDVRVIAPETLLPAQVAGARRAGPFHDMREGLDGVRRGRDAAAAERADEGRAAAVAGRVLQALRPDRRRSSRSRSPTRSSCIPGPMNRGVEIDSAVADGERSVILPQVTFGIAVRMAVMSIIAGN